MRLRCFTNRASGRHAEIGSIDGDQGPWSGRRVPRLADRV